MILTVSLHLFQSMCITKYCNNKLFLTRVRFWLWLQFPSSIQQLVPLITAPSLVTMEWNQPTGCQAAQNRQSRWLKGERKQSHRGKPQQWAPYSQQCVCMFYLSISIYRYIDDTEIDKCVRLEFWWHHITNLFIFKHLVSFLYIVLD